MIKGCHRKIYHVKNTGGGIFEEAYFILKKRVSTEYVPGIHHVSDTEMADEAERIVTELCLNCSKKPRGIMASSGKAGAFALGAVSSSAIIGTVALLLAFL